MSRIKKLTPEVSNKIAAGEVVERPSSAVKELIENAIDAGATKITVEIKNGGISYICVVDNGCGMDKDDAKMAFLRHATSKIYSENDLENINTLGFRGEALASIAAVAKVDIMTKTEETDGVYLEITDGKILSEKTVGCPVGTTIIVKNLFYNTPARMKFLKKDSTEGGYVSDIVERLILSNPNVSFKYIVDGKEKLFSDGDGKIDSCIYNVYGRDYTKYSVEINRTLGNLKIHGFVGKAEVSRGNRTFQSFFVNGRYIKNRSLTFTAERAYSNVLMTGKFPFFVVYIEIPTTEIDINVHPTKQEVKFSDEKNVCNELYWAVKDALSKSADVIRNEIVQKAKPPFFTAKSPTVKYEEQTIFTPVPKATFFGEPKTILPMTAEIPISQAKKYDYKIIGQFFNTYIAIEIKEKIILIDQHAAHERMIYEQIAKTDEKSDVVKQVLLSPIAITLSTLEYQMLKDKMDVFDSLGFEFEDFGNNSILVRQAPIDMGSEQIKNIITEILSKSKGEFSNERKSAMMYSIACKAAVKGNSRLSDSEIDVLISELMETGGINTCPHGRPIMIAITRYEMEKMFKRIQ